MGIRPILFTMSRGRSPASALAGISLTPPSFGHLPYILLNKIQGRSLNNPLFICVTSLMFCKAKHKGEGLLPFYRIIYRIAALRGVALVILGRCHKVTEGLKTPSYQSVYTGYIPFFSECPIALRRTVLAIGEYTRIIPVNYLLSHNPY